MATLEELTPGASVLGVLSDEPVTVVAVKWFGSTALELTFKQEASGRTDSHLLYRSDEPGLRIVEIGRAWAYDGDGRLFKLVSEAERIRNAALFDPQLAVSVSLIEPLPHQLAAVYEEMLPRQPLRYLLADDPGAGKTIMAGLLIKELILRGDLERCLIVAPAALAEQWQDELWDKFGLRFAVIGRSEIEGAAGNPFEEHPLCISRIDLMKQEENQERLRQVEWDLIVVDEAHKMSASYFGGEVKKTARYRLGELLSEQTRHLLLLTATPHRGKEEDFQLFLALLDGDRFEGKFRDGVHQVDVADLMRRLVKEDLVDFEGKPLFPERRAYSVNYPLSDAESQLYQAVTRYVQEQMTAADRLAADGTGEGKRRRTVVGFALTTLQRRLASSPEAIYQSISRRRKRLEHTLDEEQARLRLAEHQGELDLTKGLAGRNVEEEDLETDLSEQREEETEQVVDQASAARTIDELSTEIGHLRLLERLAQTVRRSGQDSKWIELRRLLEDRAEMFDLNGRRRKLLIFTEHRDTLNYLAERIGDFLGRQDAVTIIHGGIGREERRIAQARFTSDPDVHILVATDAAGEGINLQRAHLMVNYDLPWNPNRLEQRFGRIHRFGQREVCHCWNLVAYETREGQVFGRLLEKLEIERQALGGKVFDVLGRVFEGESLRDLLLQAIRYGDDPATRARLEQRISDVMSEEHYRRVLDEYALVAGRIDDSRLRGLKEAKERAEQQRLVPHFIAAFFVEAFQTLGGTIRERERGRYEIRNVPAEIRRRDRLIGRGTPVLQRYERIAFDRELLLMDGKPNAEFVAPGHPLLEAVIDLVVERYRGLLRRGAVLVDPREGAEAARVLFYIQNDIGDGTRVQGAERRVIGRRIHFVEIDEQRRLSGGIVAPYLDYRELHEDELPLLDRLLRLPLTSERLEEEALGYAVAELVPAHLAEVKQGREALLRKTMAAVKDRLVKEINYWDMRAEQLRAQEQAGRQPRMNSARAAETRDRLTARLQERMQRLEQERQIAAQAPVITGGALVIPEAAIDRLLGRTAPREPHEVREVERIAMGAVMDAERRAGRVPVDVSAQNVGYDVASREPETGGLRLIEVKGRIEGADTVSVTRNEMLVALNKRDAYYLAIVFVQDGVSGDPVYIQDPAQRMLSGDPLFGMVSITLDLKELLSTAARTAV